MGRIIYAKPTLNYCHNPASLEKAIKEGEITSKMSLEVVTALNKLFTADIKAKNIDMAFFLDKTEHEDGGALIGETMDDRFRRSIKGEYGGLGELTDYNVHVTEGIDIATDGEAINIRTWDEVPDLESRNVEEEMPKFSEAMQILLAIRDRLRELGYSIERYAYEMDGHADYGAEYAKSVDFSTPEKAVDEMTKALKALGIKVKRGKKK